MKENSHTLDIMFERRLLQWHWSLQGEPRCGSLVVLDLPRCLAFSERPGHTYVVSVFVCVCEGGGYVDQSRKETSRLWLCVQMGWLSSLTPPARSLPLWEEEVDPLGYGLASLG